MSEQKWAKEPLTHDGVWFKDGNGHQLGGPDAWDLDKATKDRWLCPICHSSRHKEIKDEKVS